MQKGKKLIVRLCAHPAKCRTYSTPIGLGVEGKDQANKGGESTDLPKVKNFEAKGAILELNCQNHGGAVSFCDSGCALRVFLALMGASHSWQWFNFGTGLAESKDCKRAHRQYLLGYIISINYNCALLNTKGEILII